LTLSKKKTIKKNPKLKVIIDGKVYYKKNIGDYFRGDRRFTNILYWDVKQSKMYNIKTGEYYYGPMIDGGPVEDK